MGYSLFYTITAWLPEESHTNGPVMLVSESSLKQQQEESNKPTKTKPTKNKVDARAIEDELWAPTEKISIMKPFWPLAAAQTPTLI